MNEKDKKGQPIRTQDGASVTRNIVQSGGQTKKANESASPTRNIITTASTDKKPKK